MADKKVVEWADLYLWGYTMQEVANLYGASSYSVWVAMMACGLRPRHVCGQNLWRISGSGERNYRVAYGRDKKNHIVHRAVWEHYHGTIPDGRVVHHKNGDTTDNRIENLACMTPGEHIRLHHDRAGGRDG